MEGEFTSIYSDIIFDESIIKRVLDSTRDIAIVVDHSYKYHKHLIDKNLDLIITKEKDHKHYRKISLPFENRVLRIGNRIDKNLANYEFIGIVYFSKQGAENLKKVYLDLSKNHKGKFHEAETFEKASITDMLQEMIDMGFEVDIIEINQGWIEIHNKKDYEIASKMVF
jgi:choline kinase